MLVNWKAKAKIILAPEVQKKHAWVCRMELFDMGVFKIMPTVRLFRYWNGHMGDHFYTTNWDELGDGGLGYRYEDVAGYVHKSRPIEGWSCWKAVKAAEIRYYIGSGEGHEYPDF